MTCAQSSTYWSQEGTLAQRAITASHRLSREGVRLCLGHPKAHLGTMIVGSWGGEGVRLCLGHPKAHLGTMIVGSWGGEGVRLHSGHPKAHLETMIAGSWEGDG